MPQLGRVTLITGKNNTGKSSILEAIRLLTQNAAYDTILDILTSRGEHTWSRDENSLFSDPDKDFFVSPLFHGFPSIYDDFGPIVIETGDLFQQMRLSLKAGWIPENQDPSEVQMLKNKAILDDILGEPALEIETEDTSYLFPLDYLRRRRGRLIRPFRKARMPCQIVKTYSGSDILGSLWDAILERGEAEEEEAVKALQIIDSHITAVRIVGGDSMYPTRRVLVRSDRFLRPVPLRSFGDGLNRLFAIIPSLLEARGGLLLIDEFENGLHHSVQLKVWQTIFQLARDLNVQVFATTHSRDTVETFQHAAADSPEDGILLRLAHRDDNVIPTVFVEQELAVATRRWIEVR